MSANGFFQRCSDDKTPWGEMGRFPIPASMCGPSELRYSGSMHGCVSKYGMQHALGDCYCDDWAIEDD